MNFDEICNCGKHEELLGSFNSGPNPSNKGPTLHNTHIESQQFRKNNRESYKQLYQNTDFIAIY